MAVRSGLAAQLGVATEETYGTYKAPSRFLPFESEGISLEKNYIKTAGLRAGRLSQAKNLHTATTRTVAGDFSTEFFNQGMGILLNQLHGETVTPTKIEEKSAYKQVHKIGTSDPFGKSMTVQVGRPDNAGTVRPFSYLGCKVTEFKVSIDANGVAMLSVSVDGADEVTAESLGSASYSATAAPFDFTQMVLKAGGSELAYVRNVDISVAIGQNTERYHLGNEGTKDTPIVNELLGVTASATLEFSGLTDHERYKKAETTELVLTGTGATIVEALKFKSVFTMPAAKQVSSSPVVGGPDVITQDVTFECLDDGTNPPLTVEYVSSDSTL